MRRVPVARRMTHRPKALPEDSPDKARVWIGCALRLLRILRVR